MVGVLVVLVAAERVECRRLGEVSIRFENDNLLIGLDSVYETMFSPCPPSVAMVIQGDNVLNGGGGNARQRG
jgi:hypothetical protein